MPFDELKSDDAQSRLSRCRPVSGFRPSHVEDNKIMFAHNTGEVNFRRRQPLQLASTLGFVLNQRSGTAGREEIGGGARVFLSVRSVSTAACAACWWWLGVACCFASPQEVPRAHAWRRKGRARVPYLAIHGSPL